jgi:5-methylcytosine-specific restriction endonuclease McrA
MTHQTFPKPEPKPKKRRKPLRARSERAISYAAELDEITPLLLARCHRICEICGAAPVEHRHHRLRRGQGGKNTLSNLMGLCNGCHTTVHRYPSASYDRGWLLRRKEVDAVERVGYSC